MKSKRLWCEAPGCGRPHFAKGLCLEHHGRCYGTFINRKLDAAQVREIRSLAGSMKKRALLQRFNIVRRQAVHDVIRGKTWRCLLPHN